MINDNREFCIAVSANMREFPVNKKEFCIAVSA